MARLLAFSVLLATCSPLPNTIVSREELVSACRGFDQLVLRVGHGDTLFVTADGDSIRVDWSAYHIADAACQSVAEQDLDGTAIRESNAF